MQFTSVLAAMLLYISTNRRVMFYLALKDVSAAESDSEHSLPYYHHIPFESQSTERGQRGEAEGHLPPAVTFRRC